MYPKTSIILKLKSTISYSKDFQKNDNLNNKNILIPWLFIFALCIDLILDDILLILVDCILCAPVICIPVRSTMYCL